VSALARAVLAATFASGLVAAAYVRPWGGLGGVSPARVWLHVPAAAAGRVAHAASGGALALIVVIAAARAGGARAPRAAAAVLALALVATGWLLPGDRLLLWAPAPGSNLLRPTTLDERVGPFPELIGVNVRYDDAVTAWFGRRVGPRAVARLWTAHAIALPLVAVAALVLRRRTRRRIPATPAP
jgi:hypothetical protein